MFIIYGAGGEGVKKFQEKGVLNNFYRFASTFAKTYTSLYEMLKK